MNKFIFNYLLGQLRSAAVIRYVATMIAQAIAAKFALDAAQTGALQDWLYAGLAQLVTFIPVLISQLTRPSNAAMEVAVQADKVMAGEKPNATVRTPSGVPDLKVTAQKVGDHG